MSTWALTDPMCDRNLVKLSIRRWDGIDRPEYTSIDGLTGAQARSLAVKLVALAQEADANAGAASRKKLAEKREELNKLKAQVDALEMELAQ